MNVMVCEHLHFKSKQDCLHKVGGLLDRPWIHRLWASFNLHCLALNIHTNLRRTAMRQREMDTSFVHAGNAYV